MSNSAAKLAKILDTSEEVLLGLGEPEALDLVAQENDQRVEDMLSDLGLTRSSPAEEVFDALTDKLARIDRQLFELLGRPELSKLSNDSGKVREVAFQVFTPPSGYFIKREKVVELLSKQPPQALLDHFGYSNMDELVHKEGFASVVAALRFTQTTEWMHQFFDVAYKDLIPDDFEEREVEFKILDPKWLDIAQKFIGKKFHNVSHLKEFGIIFISPDPIDQSGETLRMFILLLHYLHEVPFYSNLFRKFAADPDFIPKLQSLLRGDVLETPFAKEKAQNGNWLIIQRYLAKDDIHDPRLAMPHVSPEAEHWYRVSQSFGKLAEVMGDNDKFSISRWAELDHVGDYFGDKLVSFDVVDLVMSMVKRGETKYLYHQQEALWNRIFVEYHSRDEMNQLIEENIIKGYIEI